MIFRTPKAVKAHDGGPDRNPLQHTPYCLLSVLNPQAALIEEALLIEEKDQRQGFAGSPSHIAQGGPDIRPQTTIAIAGHFPETPEIPPYMSAHGKSRRKNTSETPRDPALILAAISRKFTHAHQADFYKEYVVYGRSIRSTVNGNWAPPGDTGVLVTVRLPRGPGVSCSYGSSGLEGIF